MEHLRVVQATAWYAPYQSGGTENYLAGLVEELAERRITSTVLLPRPEGAPQTFSRGPAAVETYEVEDPPALGELRTGRPHGGFETFVERLRRHSGAIYHQHAWTRGCGPAHLRAARELGFRTILTVHVPSGICLRGTMMRHGVRPCDGRIEPKRCAACWAMSRGAPKAIAQAVATVPLRVAEIARKSETSLGSALGARALSEARRREFGELIANADRVVAVSKWLYDALIANGAPAEKLVLSRQGIRSEFQKAVAAYGAAERGGPLKVLFLGRWDPAKGIATLVDAVRGLPESAPLQLTIRAIPGDAEGRAYEAKVRAMAADDRRIIFALPVPPEDVGGEIVRHHVLAAPSTVLETGPLVVLEAQAAGLFVLGSRLGGISELVTEGSGGMLLPPSDSKAWSAALGDLTERHRAGHPMVAGGKAMRGMSEVAAEMAALYSNLMSSAPPASSRSVRPAQG